MKFDKLEITTAQMPTDQSLVALNERARKYYSDSKADNTKIAYQSDFKHFCTFCADNELAFLPAGPGTVALYLTSLADTGFKASTITRRVSSISQAHQHADMENPTRHASVRAVLAGIKRNIGTAQHGVSPVMDSDLRAMLPQLRPGLIGKRDRALLLIGFLGAFRRSELVALNVEDIEVTRDGMIVTITRSKTDPTGMGEKIGIPKGNHPETCPVIALRAWLQAADISSGPIFFRINRHGQVIRERLSGKAVAIVVKEMCQRIGLDGSRFAGHSLRAGFCGSTAKAGVQERIIMKTTRHRSVQMLRRYIRESSLLSENAAKSLGF